MSGKNINVSGELFLLLAFVQFCGTFHEVRSTHIIWQRSGHLDSTHIDVDSCKLKAFLLFECTSGLYSN